MSDLSNYDLSALADGDQQSTERHPANHVRFSPLLKPAKWIDRIHRLFGSRAFKLKNAMLRELDSAAPIDRCLGTPEELQQLRKLVESYADGRDNNPFISSTGRLLGKKMILDWLKNRKKVLQHYHSNREFIDAKGSLKSPVIITGLPRSGSTLLQRLMSEDPNTRSPFTFEMEVPLPPMPSGVDPLNDPRIKSSNAAINTASRFMPGFVEKLAESHLWSATEKEESFLYMLSHNGVPSTGYLLAGKNFIDDFFRIEDKRSVFRYERLFFSMLNAYRPAKSHWTFKAPHYAPYFPLIFDEYSDARVIVTHRNPMVTLPSTCRLFESMLLPFYEDGTFDKHGFGKLKKIFIDKCLMVPFDYRKSHPEKEHQIFDCLYQELFSDPISLVKKIYHQFDMAYSEIFENRMKAYLESNRQGKYGRHQYGLEEYGFEAEKIHQDYREYMDYFGYGIAEKVDRPAAFDYGLDSEKKQTEP